MSQYLTEKERALRNDRFPFVCHSVDSCATRFADLETAISFFNQQRCKAILSGPTKTEAYGVIKLKDNPKSSWKNK